MEIKSIGQNKTSMEKWNERFAVADGIGESGSYKLTADGCYQRHNISRDEQMVTDRESQKRNWEFPNNAEREERSIQLNLFKSVSLGYKLRDDESAEDLISRAKEDERWME